MHFKGKTADGTYVDPSNNGDALCRDNEKGKVRVIMNRLVIVLALLCAVQCNALVSTYICPPEIAVTWEVSSLPPEWQTFRTDTSNSVRHPLASAAFTDGHPKELAFLRPTAGDAADTAAGSIRTSVYNFSAASPDGIWLMCQYHNTPAIIFRKLPISHKECKVTQSEDDNVRSIRCR